MLTVYGMASSGNCHKLKMLLDHLGEPYRWVETNIMAGESRTPEYLAKNPNGKVPLLEIEPGAYLAESNAILCYLAEDTALLPADRYVRAQVLQWLFFEQYSHEPYIAVARFIKTLLPADHPRHADLPRLQERGYQALGVMETHLRARAFFVHEHFTVADIALYAYTHAAAGGGFDLGKYGAVRAWLDRVAAQPGVTAMAGA